MPKRILTPLEKIDLAAINLVAIVETDENSIAMVEEASGKGYIVKLGTYTYIGRHHGRMSQIKSGSIMIGELIKNYKGKYVEQFQEIKLLKKDGEG
jgi:type IV pilus assembly protein PilP